MKWGFNKGCPLLCYISIYGRDTKSISAIYRNETIVSDSDTIVN